MARWLCHIYHPHLVDSRQDDDRVWSRMVLTRMGYRAVMPLTEALNAEDDRLVASPLPPSSPISVIQRALPKLQQISWPEKTTETVKRVRNAVAAIAARAAYSEPEGPMLYFQEGLRYFRDGDQVRDELMANQSLVWRWYEDRDGWRQLHYDQVPGLHLE